MTTNLSAASYQPTTNHYNNHSSTGNRQNHHHHNSTPAKRHYDVTHDSDFRSPHTGHQKKDGDFRARACSDYDMRRSSLPGNDKDFRHEVLSLNSNHHKTTDATQKGSNGCQLLVGGLRSNSASSAPTDSQTGKVFDYSQHPHAAQGVFRGVGKATPMKPFNHMMSNSPYNSRSDHLGSANHKSLFQIYDLILVCQFLSKLVIVVIVLVKLIFHLQKFLLIYLH